jgi:hypothetical protein
MEIKRSNAALWVIAGVLVLVMVTGAAVPAMAVPAMAAPAPTPPALTDQQRIAELERQVKDLRGQVGALYLLRAHDVQSWQSAIAQDRQISLAQRREMLKELYHLQLAVYGNCNQ